MFELLINGLQTLGAILIGVMALRVHHRVVHEKKIDADVIAYMKVEQWIGKVGIGLLLAGFILKGAMLFM